MNYHCNRCLHRETNKCRSCSEHYTSKYEEDRTYMETRMYNCSEHECPNSGAMCNYFEHCDGTFFEKVCSITKTKCTNESFGCAECKIALESKNEK